MEPGISKKSPTTSDEEECSSDEERSDGRRRRFCIERVKQSGPDNGFSAKRPRMETMRGRPSPYYRGCGVRPQRPPCTERLKRPEPNDDQPRHIEVITDSDRGRANTYFNSRVLRRGQDTCMERLHQAAPDNRPKQIQVITANRNRPSSYDRGVPDRNRRPKSSDEAQEALHHQQHHQYQPQEQLKVIPVPLAQPTEKQVQETKAPVIFINPKFIKKFIEKSIKLTSTSSTATNSSTASMIDDINFKTSPKESVQAASTMAIIRLVTECIEDDSKRDEKLNKILVSRLVEALQDSAPPDQAE